MKTLTHKFVRFIPQRKDLEDGVLYVALDYGTIIHKCCCGCGNEVATPLSPTDWKLTYDGETITLFPSIGNWNFDCQSHYWIKKSKVIMAVQLSKDDIKIGRENDRSKKLEYFNTKFKKPIPEVNYLEKNNTWWSRFISFLKR